MSRSYQAPEAEVREEGTVHERMRYTHPAYAVIGISRVQSTGHYLFGSDFLHRTFITVRIQRAMLDRHLSDDWIHSESGGGHLVEIHMSEAQFASMISNLNMGDGTPCTLQWMNGDYVPGISEPRGSMDEFETEIRQTVAKAGRRIDDTIAEIEGEMGKGLSKKRREAILDHLEALRGDLKSNVPFIMDQFGEHMETQIEAAKVEVTAHSKFAALPEEDRQHLRLHGGIDTG